MKLKYIILFYYSLDIISSYDRGHSMSVVHHGVPNREKIMALFRGDAKKKIYLYWSRGGIFGMSHCGFPFLIFLCLCFAPSPYNVVLRAPNEKKEVIYNPMAKVLWQNPLL